MPAFLVALRQEMSVTHAAEAVGISRAAAYKARDVDAVFAAKWDECWQQNVDGLEQSAFRRARDGWLEPVFHNGKECGMVRKYDNRLTWNFLQKWRSERYDDATGIQDFATALREAIQRKDERYE